MSSPITLQQTPIATYLTDHQYAIESALQADYRILAAQSVEELRQQYNANHPQLLIVDDIAACRAIRPDVDSPILVITEADRIRDALDAGAADTILPNSDERLMQQRAHALLQTYTPYTYEHVPVMVHSTYPNGNLRYVNQEWQQVMGYTRDEVIGRHITNFMDEDSKQRVSIFAPTFWDEAGIVRDYWVRFISKSGEEIDVLLDSDLKASFLGEQASLTFGRDITDLKHIESTLRQSEQQIQTILAALDDAIMLMNRDGVYLRVLTPNQQAVSRPQDGLEGKSITEIAGEERGQDIIDMIARVLDTRETDSMEYQVALPKSGDKAWYHATFSPIVDRDEVVVVTRNITEQKQIEESLRSSERRYRNLIESANDGILLIDIQTTAIMESNPQVSRMLGYSQDELTGMPINEIELPEEIDDDIGSNLGVTNQLIVEARYRRRDGSIIPVETSSRIVEYNGAPALLCFVREITQRKRALQAEQEQRRIAEVLRDTAAAFNVALTLDDVLDTLLKNVARIVDHNTVNIMLIDDGIGRVVRLQGYDEIGLDVEAIENQEIVIAKSSNLSTIVQTHEAYIIYDTQTADIRWADPTTVDWIRSLVSVPIVIDGNVQGFINVDSAEVATFNQEDADRLQIFADQAAIAIQKATLFEETQQYASDLEARVAERTKALSEANQQLKEQIVQRHEIEDQLEAERSLLRSLIETIPDEIYIKDSQRRFVMANAATLQTLNVTSLDDVIGKTDYDLMPKADADRYIENEERILNTGEPQLRQMHHFVDDKGQPTYLVITKLPLRDPQGNITGIIGINHDITDLKRTEEQLDQVLTSARCLLWYATVQKFDDETYDWDIQIANEQAAQTFLPLANGAVNYTDAWQDAILPDDQERRRAVFAIHLAHEYYNYSYEFRCKLASGDIHWLAEDVQIHQVDDTTWRAVGVVTDITDIKNVQDELKQLNTELEQRVDERTEKLSQANEELRQEVLERKRAEDRERQQRILSDTLRDTVTLINSTLDQDAVFNHLLSAMRTIIPHDASCILLLDDSTLEVVKAENYPRPLEGTTYDIHKMTNLMEAYHSGDSAIVKDISTFEDWQDDDLVGTFYSNISVPIPMGEEIIGFLCLDSRDKNNFTPQHAEWLQSFASQVGNAIRNARMVEEIRNQALLFEQQVIERTAELEMQRAQLDAILDAMRDGVAFQNLERKVNYINRAMERITGYSEQAWLSGDAQEQLNTESDDVREEQFRKVNLSLDKRGYWQGETVLRRANGDLFDASLVRTEVHDNEGKRTGIVTVLRDISQEKELERQKARFIASASHELRTPITNIKTRLFLIRRRPEQVDEHLEVISSVITMMQNLVETMFDISRFERGVINLDFEQVHIQHLVQDILKHHDAEAFTKDIGLYEALPEDPIYAEADRYRIAQVITNLVKNALNYTPPEGTVRVAVQERNDTVEIHVQDTGKGIAPEDREHLFKPFYRSQEDNLGAGLGLSISHEIVLRHGGDISVESELGKGSHFVVRLPLKQSKTKKDS